MTPKRRAFVRAVVAGAGPSEAYRAAYATGGMSAKTIANEAHRLMCDPDISRAIEEGMEAAMTEAAWCRATAIERLEQVNQRCFDALMDGDAINRDALNGFTTTVQALNELCNVPAEVREDFAARFQTKEKLVEAAKRNQMIADASFEAFGASL